MRPTVVCLDAGNTLFKERLGRPALYAECFQAAGVQVSEASLRDWMPTVHDTLPALVEGEARYSRPWFRAFVRELLLRAGDEREPEPLRAELEKVFTRPETYVVFADTFPALDSLVEAGFRLAVVSNWSDRLEDVLSSLGLARYFEAIAISAVVGADKPDPRLFRHALQQLGVEPREAVHVGDHPRNDQVGARRAGMTGWLIDRSAQGVASSDVLVSLEELAGRLAAL